VRKADPLAMTGQTVSNYRIIEKLCVGGRKVVHDAEDIVLGRGRRASPSVRQQSADKHCKNNIAVSTWSGTLCR
jgi:hypothetical protein